MHIIVNYHNGLVAHRSATVDLESTSTGTNARREAPTGLKKDAIVSTYAYTQTYITVLTVIMCSHLCSH